MTAVGQIRIGISGWNYASWRGVFYPPGLAHRRELDYAATRFPTIEINGTFYGLQRPESFARWHAETPKGFVFAVKGHRFLTHLKQLVEVRAPLANFLASGVLRLGDKLGPLLWQFPGRFRFNPGKMERFLDLLPQDTEAAARLAREHEPRLAGRAWTETDAPRPLRHALEVRHPSFADPLFLDMLRGRGVALVWSDAPGWSMIEAVTAGFVYVRLHGSQELYASGYDAADLEPWAQRLHAWSRQGLDSYVYFDNDARVRAPFDALTLIARCRQEPAAGSGGPPT